MRPRALYFRRSYGSNNSFWSLKNREAIHLLTRIHFERLFTKIASWRTWSRTPKISFVRRPDRCPICFLSCSTSWLSHYTFPGPKTHLSRGWILSAMWLGSRTSFILFLIATSVIRILYVTIKTFNGEVLVTCAF